MPTLRTAIRTVAALGLIVSLFAGLSATATAQVTNPSTYPTIFTQSINECYFASVSNGENFGLGASHTSVTVQNLGGEDGVIYLKVGKAGFERGQFALLRAGASKTFSANELGVPAGTTTAVVAMGYELSAAQAADFSAQTAIPIGCVAKQAVAGANLPTTTTADSAVSGYNATSGREVGHFHDLYLPIVQTNCGPGGCWDTIIRVANVGPYDNAAVTVRFFPADDGSGSLSTGFQVQRALDQGQVASIRLSDLVPNGWVGSAHVYTDDSVVAIADRFKVGTNMWITNTASNAVAERALQLPAGPSSMPYVLYAPDVRLDYNGWNTGISVANTVDADNTVNIQYFGTDGNAPQAQTARVAAHGMTYFYNPSSPSEDGCAQPANQVATCDFVGGAIVLSQAPVAVAVDGVKYFGNDANVGQAFTYNATGNVFQFQAAPLVQKGSPSTGMGATSGITFLNVNALGTYVTTTWINPSGTNASNFGPSVVWVPGYATGFVYTMTQNNLPNGFVGSAYVASEQPIAATSANVDYQVSGDGTAIFNLYNPCGLYRQLGDCTLPAVVPDPATKTFDVRPQGADAWICVYNTTTGQDNKPQNRTGECIPNWHFAKGAGTGGQGQPTAYVANTVSIWNGATGAYDTAAPGHFIDFAINTRSNVATATLNRNGFWEPFIPSLFTISAWVRTDGTPANINLTCAEVGSPPANGFEIRTFDGNNLTGADIALLGNLENAVVELEVNGVRYCGQLEAGRLTQQTPDQLAATNGAVAVIRTDSNGRASIQLPPGCYDFVVSARGYVTQINGNECLASGETVPNVFDLVAATASFTKYICASINYAIAPGQPGHCIGPINAYDITLTGPNNTTYTPVALGNGGYRFDNLALFQRYKLCWDDGFEGGTAGCEWVHIQSNVRMFNDLNFPPATKLFNVDAGESEAWMCVYAAEAGAHDDSVCAPHWVVQDGVTGQNASVETFALNAGLDAYDVEAQDVGITVSLDANATTVSATTHVYGDWNPIAVSTIDIYAWVVTGANAPVAGNPILTCSALVANNPPTGFERAQYDGVRLATAEDAWNELPGHFVVEYQIDGNWYCSQLANGALELQSIDEFRATDDAIAVEIAAPDGTALLRLAQGCYDIIVSADDRATSRELNECFEAGYTYTNEPVLAADEVLGTTATKVFDVTPDDAWVCVYAVTPGNQAVPDGDCLPEQVFVPNVDTGPVQRFVATDFSYAYFNQYMSSQPSAATVTAIADTYLSPMQITVDFAARTVTSDPATHIRWIGFLQRATGASPTLQCSDINRAYFWDGAGWTEAYSDTGIFAPGELETITNYSQALFQLNPFEDTINFTYCAKIQPGYLRAETTAEAIARLGSETAIEPFQLTPGQPDLILEPGCYVFVISAPDSTTETSQPECFGPNDSITNTVTLDDRVELKPFYIMTVTRPRVGTATRMEPSAFAVHVASAQDGTGGPYYCKGEEIYSGRTPSPASPPTGLRDISVGFAVIEVPVGVPLCVMADPNGDGIFNGPALPGDVSQWGAWMMERRP